MPNSLGLSPAINRFKGNEQLLATFINKKIDDKGKNHSLMGEENIKKFIENFRDQELFIFLKIILKQNRFYLKDFSESLENLDKMKVFKYYYVENNFNLIKRQNRKKRQTLKGLNLSKAKK